ncbi:DMT family transporter [Pseudonocardiaceae bacterium YIM PH 21723]|nr:DMT family transporter [Pseudonocardiaceae bacterium YIM PH 21723]
MPAGSSGSMSSLVIGSRVSGCSCGGMADGRSATMLYQDSGMSCWDRTICLTMGIGPHWWRVRLIPRNKPPGIGSDRMATRMLRSTAVRTICCSLFRSGYDSLKVLVECVGITVSVSRMEGSRLTGAAYAGVGTVLAGTSFAATSLLTRYPFLSGQTLRFAVGGLALVVVLLWMRARWPRPTARELGLLALLAATGLAGFNLAALEALRYSEPAALGVLVGCTPVLVALVGPFFVRRKPSAPIVGAAVIVVIGAAIVIGLGATTWLGLVFGLLTLLGETAFTVLAVPVLPRLGPVVVSTYVCLIAAVEMAVLSLLLEYPGFRVPTASEAWALLYLALAVTAVAFIAYYGGIQRIGAERASLFAGLIPVASAFAAPVVGTGHLGWPQVIGSVIVGAGITLGMATPSKPVAPEVAIA